MSLSLIAKSIGESATLKLNEVAAILRAKGDPVIHLGGGEPKGKAPHYSNRCRERMPGTPT
jgi:aspartate aminotransferase